MKKQEVCKIFNDYLSGRNKNPDIACLEKFSANDWQKLTDSCKSLKIAPLIYQGIKNYSFLTNCIPNNIKEELKNNYLQSTAHNCRIFFEAKTALKILKESHIPTIALKGISLAKMLYADTGLRPMTDIDILVKKNDLIKAGRALLAMGYKQKIPSWEKVAQDSCHLPSFSRQGMPIIELHWHLLHPNTPLKIDIDSLWEKTRVIEIDGLETLSLSLENLLLHLCLHASCHEEFKVGLIAFCDIARLIQIYQKEINWNILIQTAYQWNAQRCLYLTLLVTHSIFNLDLPAHFMDELKPNDFNPLFVAEAEKLIFAERIHNSTYGKRACNLTCGSFLTLLKGAFPSRSLIARRYIIRISSAKLYIYYFINLSRLFINYGWLLLKLISANNEILESCNQEKKRDEFCRWITKT